LRDHAPAGAVRLPVLEGPDGRSVPPTVSATSG
jgi:hypothetical protein